MTKLDARLDRLEAQASGRGQVVDLAALTDDELRALAGPPDPRLEAALKGLTDNELRALAFDPSAPAPSSSAKNGG